MEAYLCRAMEVARLSPEQLSDLQDHEKTTTHLTDYDKARKEYKTCKARIQRCLFPWEIQGIFGLKTLKEHYSIPKDELAAQANHNDRLRSQFAKAGIKPDYDIPETNVERMHEFDSKVLDAVLDCKIDLTYQGGKEKKQAKAFRT